MSGNLTVSVSGPDDEMSHANPDTAGHIQQHPGHLTVQQPNVGQFSPATSIREPVASTTTSIQSSPGSWRAIQSSPGNWRGPKGNNREESKDDLNQITDLTGKKVEPWEIAYFNGAAILDDIPVEGRDTQDQVVFRGARSEPGQMRRRKTLDANRYATKKTIAQGMLDVALLTANASQLKYVLQVGEENHPFYTLMLTLIIISIVLQVIVGIMFLVIGGLNINDETEQKIADVLNDVITVLVFIITLINIVLSGFGIRTTDVNVPYEKLATTTLPPK